MRRLLVETLPEPGSRVELDEHEARHAIQVLRLREGDEVELLDGKGARVRGLLVLTRGDPWIENPSFPIEFEKPSQIPPFHLALGILKGDAMEWSVEKAVELGVSSLTPLICERSVVQIRGKGADSFQTRWQRIADQSLKQCGRMSRMKVFPPVSPDEFVPRKEILLFADESLDREDSHLFITPVLKKLTSEVTVLIGPEGGWSQSERALFLALGKNLVRFHLGALTLRAETAALFIASALQLQLTKA